MPRRARIVLPGVPLHMIQRGNNRSACFFAREDYSYYLENLAELARKHNCAVHAYCLMTNHVHLLLTPGDSLAPVPRIYSSFLKSLTFLQLSTIVTGIMEKT